MKYKAALKKLLSYFTEYFSCILWFFKHSCILLQNKYYWAKFSCGKSP